MIILGWSKTDARVWINDLEVTRDVLSVQLLPGMQASLMLMMRDSKGLPYLVDGELAAIDHQESYRLRGVSK